MRTSLSSLITKKLIHNSNRYIMATKTKQGWLWKDKKYILNSIQYCRDYLQSENINIINLTFETFQSFKL